VLCSGRSGLAVLCHGLAVLCKGERKLNLPQGWKSAHELP
jgi:hypothetical protein